MAPISFILSVRLSARVSARIPLDGFPRNLILGIFMKICRENPNLFNPYPANVENRVSS